MIITVGDPLRHIGDVSRSVGDIWKRSLLWSYGNQARSAKLNRPGEAKDVRLFGGLSNEKHVADI